ncbi:DEAD/DEAH box helicase [Falsirhodobacter sp. alg1]|uniref:DEAD/DEAH box helicase n=1 Tax=Falsirhodobacter sp. alg1 TaxID=1472418 RepID=UPI0005F094C9|nr:DEAD/DEAH box helicase [Falsirhodobacter sp. alg1]
MTKFSDLALDPRVLKAVQEAGYESPTPIQAQAIPHALEGKDVLGIAQTGTGKTASFTLPMITLLGKGRARARMPRSLVLAPTRELAAQVAENFDTYAKHTKLTKALLIGGVSFGEQDKLIDRGVDVLIATPGRLLDHFERGKLLLTGVQIMVVDEADRMLDMGFIPDIERIFSLTPFTRQTFFYSATMAPEIERITNTFLQSAVKIEVARQNSTSATIEQALVSVTPSRKDRSFADKRNVLRDLIRSEGDACTNAIIFCNRKIDVDVVAKSLKSHGFNAAPIHGDLEQRQRMATLDQFREGSLQLLVASDVAARGLDVPSVSHVFNFDVPTHPEDYVHRIGRTGRAGRKGKAYTLATPADEKYVTAIETLVGQPIPRSETPAPVKDAPATPTAEGESSGRRRTRSRRRNEDAAPAAVVETAAAPPPVVAEPAPQERTKQDHRPRNRNTREDGPVVGLGDHVPDFLTRSFAVEPAVISDEN